MKKKTLIIGLSALALAIGGASAFAAGASFSGENAVMTKAAECNEGSFDFVDGKPDGISVSAPSYTIDASSAKRGASFGKSTYSIATTVTFDQVSKIEITATTDGTDASISAYVGKTSFGSVSLSRGNFKTYTITGSSYLDGKVTIMGPNNSGTNVWISHIEIYTYQKNVEGFTIDAGPDKIYYIEGEKLDLTGMVVTVIYEDGTSEVTTDYTTSPEEGAALSPSDTDLTVFCDAYSETIDLMIASQSELNDWAKAFLGLTASPCSNPESNNLKKLEGDVWNEAASSPGDLSPAALEVLPTYVPGTIEGDLNDAIARYDHIINRYLSLRDFLQRRTATSSAKGMLSSGSDNGDLNLAVTISCACLAAGLSVFFAIRNKKKES